MHISSINYFPQFRISNYYCILLSSKSIVFYTDMSSEIYKKNPCFKFSTQIDFFKPDKIIFFSKYWFVYLFFFWFLRARIYILFSFKESSNQDYFTKLFSTSTDTSGSMLNVRKSWGLRAKRRISNTFSKWKIFRDEFGAVTCTITLFCTVSLLHSGPPAKLTLLRVTRVHGVFEFIRCASRRQVRSYA